VQQLEQRAQRLVIIDDLSAKVSSLPPEAFGQIGGFLAPWQK
jgi:hypothetical protein